MEVVDTTSDVGYDHPLGPLDVAETSQVSQSQAVLETKQSCGEERKRNI